MTYLQNQIENLIRIAQEEESYEPYYEVLEKITLSGAEYFDLGYKVSDFEIGDTIRFEGIVKGTEASTIGSSGSKLMYAIGNDGGQWLGKAQNGTKYAFGSSNQGTIDFNVEVLANITIALSGSASRPTFTISGSVTSDTATSTITQRSATPTYYDFHLLFGAGTKSTGEIAYGGDYTFKVGKIYINGTKTKDYIPVLDSQMRPCLYDRISKTFVYAKKISDGTDATSTLVFKRWNKYDVDYIESSGTQYIDTKYIPTNNSVYKFKAECTEDASGVRTVFGSRNTNDTASSVAYLYNSSSNARWATNTLKNNIATALEPHTCTLSKNGYEVDGINEQFAGQTFTGTSTNSVYLFAIHLADDTAGSISKIKCWNFDIEENGILVRSYKPTVWHNGDTTAVACLYDEVYNKMYTNAGTGSFKAYITNISTTKTNVFTTTGATSGKAINAEGTIINSSASSYSALLPIVGGTVIECVSGDTGNNNYRYHTYDSSGNWIEQSLLLYAEGTGRVEPVTGSFTAPANAKYVRVSYATTASDTIQVKSAVETTYEVGKSISNGQGAGYDLSVPYSNNFVFEAITTCKTTSSNYFMDTRKVISGSSATYQNDTGAFGIGGSSSGSTMNWKDGTGDNVVIATNGTNWSRVQSSLPFRYNAKLVGWDETVEGVVKHKRTAVFYHFGSGNNSDRVVTNGANVANNRATVTLLYTTNSNTLSSGSDLSYIYFAQDGVVEYEVIPVRNATDTTIIGMFNRVTGSFVTRLTISGSPTQVFNALS